MSIYHTLVGLKGQVSCSVCVLLFCILLVSPVLFSAQKWKAVLEQHLVAYLLHMLSSISSKFNFYPHPAYAEVTDTRGWKGKGTWQYPSNFSEPLAEADTDTAGGGGSISWTAGRWEAVTQQITQGTCFWSRSERGPLVFPHLLFSCAKFYSVCV